MKPGPKGPRKVKGKVLETLLEEHEKNPGKPSHWLSERILARTGVDVKPRTVRDHLQNIKKGSLQRHQGRVHRQAIQVQH
jgi:transposase